MHHLTLWLPIVFGCGTQPPLESPKEALMPATVEGVARNSKVSAVLIEESERVVHLGGVDGWPVGIDGRRVRATGTLGREARLPRASEVDGEISQGVAADSEPEWWLDGAAWTALPEITPFTVVVADGSGNVTTLTSDPPAFDYAPVTPDVSSSGTYSGGPPASGSLDAEALDALLAQVHELEAASAQHVAVRAMGTTQVQVTTPDGARTTLLAPDAATGLDTALRALRSPTP